VTQQTAWITGEPRLSRFRYSRTGLPVHFLLYGKQGLVGNPDEPHAVIEKDIDQPFGCTVAIAQDEPAFKILYHRITVTWSKAGLFCQSPTGGGARTAEHTPDSAKAPHGLDFASRRRCSTGELGVSLGPQVDEGLIASAQPALFIDDVGIVIVLAPEHVAVVKSLFGILDELGILIQRAAQLRPVRLPQCGKDPLSWECAGWCWGRRRR
jgi:hypothetical protein